MSVWSQRCLHMMRCQCGLNAVYTSCDVSVVTTLSAHVAMSVWSQRCLHMLRCQWGHNAVCTCCDISVVTTLSAHVAMSVWSQRLSTHVAMSVWSQRCLHMLLYQCGHNAVNKSCDINAVNLLPKQVAILQSMW